MTVPHIPILRLGEVYESMETLEIKDHRSGELLALVSQSNPGLIKRDRKKIQDFKSSLNISQLQDIAMKAAEIFVSDSLYLSEGVSHSPQEYVSFLSASSGMPESMCLANMQKVKHVMQNIHQVMDGLTRGLDLSVLDRGYGQQNSVPVSYFKACSVLGAVLPSNSPGVNSLWIPSLIFSVPVFIKPGRDEPWTPFRIMQAFLKAGLPKEMLSFYPTSHEGAHTIMAECDRALLFGDSKTTAPYLNDTSIEIHGPGYSKLVIADDKVDDWQDYLETMYDSVMANGGRSCINCSTIVVSRHAKLIAEALAKKMVTVHERSMKDPEALLSSFANKAMADWIDSSITEDLLIEGAEDVTGILRQSPRKVVLDEGVYIRPTLIYCESSSHPSAQREFMFPYVSVIEMSQETMIKDLGDSLVVTLITDNEELITEAINAEHIDRLNIGDIPTTRVEWDQPHEGNLFEFLYKRRALQRASVEPTLLPGFQDSVKNSIQFSVNAIENINKQLSVYDAKNILLVSDKGLLAAGHVQRLEKTIMASGRSVFVYTDVHENPDSEDVKRCLSFTEDKNIDLIIALGGGSSLDTAKAVNLILSCGGQIKDYKGIGSSDKTFLPLVAIPTTSGTGSECQSFALIIDHETGMKMACGDKKLMASTVILDPILTLTQPKAVTCTTAIDAIVHSLETAVTVKASDESRLYSFEAFKLLVNNFTKVVTDPDDIKARSAMQLAAAYAGSAIEKSMLGGAHAMANPLSAHHGLAHGVAVGLMIPSIIKFNSKDNQVKQVYKKMAVHASLAKNSDSADVAVQKIIDSFYDFLRLADLPKKLKSVNVFEKDVKTLSEEAVLQWTGTFNPLPLTLEDFTQMYTESL